MIWLYIFEDGAIYKSDVRPSAEDFLAVEEGILTILLIRYYNNQVNQLTGEGEIVIEHCLFDTTCGCHIPVPIEDPNG